MLYHVRYSCPFISLCHCCVDSRKGRTQRVKHWEINAENLSVVAAKKQGNELRGARNYTGT